MAQVKINLPIDADIRAVITAAGGDPDSNRWSYEENAWYADAPSQRATNAAVKKYDHDAAVLPGLKERRLAELANLRWHAEIAGTTTVLGKRVSSTRDSQAMVHGAMLSNASKINFKTLDGWEVVTQAQLGEIQKAVIDHVQACFTRECELAAKINAAKTIAELEAIKLEF